MQIVLQDRR